MEFEYLFNRYNYELRLNSNSRVEILMNEQVITSVAAIANLWDAVDLLVRLEFNRGVSFGSIVYC